MSQQSPPRPTKDPKPIPGPSGLDWLGQIRRLLGDDDPTTLLLRLRERYGPVVRLYMPTERTEAYLLADPAHVQHVLESNQGNYRKSAVYREELAEVFGQGLLTSEGELWARQNRTISPMFTKGSVYSFARRVVEETEAMLDRWAGHAERGEPIDLLAEMERLTLIIIGKAMFSTDMGERAEEMGASLQVLRRQFQRRTSAVWAPPAWLPTPFNRRAEAARDHLDDLVYEMIERRRGETGTYDDLLTMLMAARDEETGERMSDEQVRDEITTFLLAGHETTAAALTWTWYLLARNATTHEKLHECVTSSASLDTQATFSPQLADELSYVRQCVQEAMRIYPPVPVFSRETRETDYIDGYEIPAGSEVLLSQFVVHRDPAVWDDPLTYRPSRFAPGTETDRPRYSYFPFGGGARMCTGRQFALMEAQLILALAARRYRLELVSPSPEADTDVGISSAVTMIPDEPLEMAVSRW